ncbi:hypothetical protein HPB51_024129 [Rhipicephalus microplus]|uniref:Uncharacterized protein n=1 Tax=Rhipicephalus microplus TaxID=6941 RepID=A0A9J6EEB2_RHIMP|nr:hypothetical protein HPB51_024129 [Rhipicephalus microplus]
MAKAAEAGRPVQGAKGITPLINLQHFNIIWGFTPDYMHCVLLGVARQMTEDWLSNVGEEYYIGAPQTVAVLDQRLCSIKPHSCMPRLPRSVSLRKYWKASEWQQWLLYFSLPCLEGLLPRQYLKHFALLVKGIALLLQDTVSLSDISVSTDCLVKFVVDMQFLYGEKNMTFNVHQLLHMAQSVLNQGPLWAHSCFAFESNIGQIKQLVTSAKGAPLQIVERLMMASNFRYLKASASPCTLKFLTKAGPSNSKGGLLLSKPRAVSDQLLHLVQDHVGNIVRGRVMEHDRVIVSPGVRFHNAQLCRWFKRWQVILWQAVRRSAASPKMFEHVHHSTFQRRTRLGVQKGQLPLFKLHQHSPLFVGHWCYTEILPAPMHMTLGVPQRSYLDRPKLSQELSDPDEPEAVPCQSYVRKKKRPHESVPVTPDAKRPPSPISLMMRKPIDSLQDIVNGLRESGKLTPLLTNLLEKVCSSTSQEEMDRILRDYRASGTKAAVIKTVGYPRALRSLALTLLCFSLEAYEDVQKLYDVAIPPVPVARAWMSNTTCGPGFPGAVYENIREKATTSPSGRLLCTLIVDDMSIRKEISHDGRNVRGYIDFGMAVEDDSLPAARNVLVFVVVSLQLDWKAPCAYFFIDDLSKLHDVRADVVAVTFGGPTFSAGLLRELGADPSPESMRPWFPHPEQPGARVYVVFDAHQMQALVKTSLALLHRICDSTASEIRWNYVMELHRAQAFIYPAGHRFATVDWDGLLMRVNLSEPVLGLNFANGIEFCGRALEMPQFRGCEATIRFIKTFHQLTQMLRSTAVTQTAVTHVPHHGTPQDTHRPHVHITCILTKSTLCKVASLCDLDSAKRDQMRIHLRNNIFTVSVATTNRAIAYQRITSILLGEDRQIELHMNAPPHDNAIPGIAFYAQTFPTDDEALKDFQESNLDYQIPPKSCASTYDPLIKELTQTISALKSQMATQQTQIETLLAQNRSLESRLAKASQFVHNSTAQPQPAAAAKHKAMTSTEMLQSEEDTTVRIIQTVNASIAQALCTTVHATVADTVRAAVTEAFATVDSHLTSIET